MNWNKFNQREKIRALINFWFIGVSRHFLTRNKIIAHSNLTSFLNCVAETTGKTSNTKVIKFPFQNNYEPEKYRKLVSITSLEYYFILYVSLNVVKLFLSVIMYFSHFVNNSVVPVFSSEMRAEHKILKYSMLFWYLSPNTLPQLT